MKYFSENYFEGLKNIVIEYTFSNYDYCYLRAMHEKNRREGTRTIIAGSSHAMNGIVNENISGGCINFSISSQDVYYDYRHIQKAVEEGRQKIERCIINIGYYMLYQDLSYSKMMSYLIPTVYYPLLGDAHHYLMEKEYDFFEKVSVDRSLYSAELIKKICEEWATGFFLEESSFYGNMKTREDNNILGLKKIIWNTLKEEEKEQAAIERTNEHNHLKQHTLSRIENGNLIKEIVEYLYEHAITPIFVIFPFTAWYNRYIDRSYKEDIFELLDSIPFPIEFLDMNDYEGVFCDADFLDTDHMNKQGALKATEVINEFVKMLE